MPFLELFDETLDINSTENYELSVQVSTDNLSFCILDTLRNKFVLLRSYEPVDKSKYESNTIREIINKDDFLIRRYKKVSLTAISPKFTLVPASLYDESKKDVYFAFNQVPSEEETILTSKLPNPDSLVIYSFPAGIADILKTAFPGNIFMHHLKPLFNFISFSQRSFLSNNVHIHLERDYLNIIIFDQNTLKFCNTFYYKTISDIQYYILYVLKRLNIRQEEIINFSGNAMKQEEILHGFSDYLNAIKFAIPTGNYTFSYVFSETELQKFLILFSAVNCE
jgi:hypothetical protein